MTNEEVEVANEVIEVAEEGDDGEADGMDEEDDGEEYVDMIDARDRARVGAKESGSDFSRDVSDVPVSQVPIPSVRKCIGTPPPPPATLSLPIIIIIIIIIVIVIIVIIIIIIIIVIISIVTSSSSSSSARPQHLPLSSTLLLVHPYLPGLFLACTSVAFDHPLHANQVQSRYALSLY